MRQAAEAALPPDRLLPDRQPAYMASWIYVFGVLTVVSLAWVIITGCIFAIMGPSWWHVSSAGHFVNSLHLWSVEAFFFFMVIHLWGKFFMAAWRGNRRLTWVTGVISFLVSVGGGLYGLPVATELRLSMDLHPGQGRHQLHRRRHRLERPEFRPDAHVAHRAAANRRRHHRALHLLLVRRRGIVPPFAEGDRHLEASRRARAPGTLHERPPRRGRRFNPDRDVKEWKGAYVPYDILKEAFIAFLAVAVLIVLLAVVFSSPDEPAVTLKTWSVADPVDFAQTAITELDGTSAVATYGPALQRHARLVTAHRVLRARDQWLGVHQPIDTAQDFVIGPLRTLPNQPVVHSRAQRFTSAPRRRSRMRGRRPTRRLSPTRPMSTGDCTFLGPLWTGRRRSSAP